MTNKLRLGDTELTPRESEVMAKVAEGYRSKEIARMLCLSIHTVRAHRLRANRKWRAVEGEKP